MKRTLLFILTLAVVGQLSAQSKFAFEIGPTLSWSKAKDDIKDITAEGLDTKLKLSIALIRETFIQDNIGIVVGIGYKTKRFAYEFSNTATNVSGEVSANTGYVTVPLAIRLHTSEFTENINAFLQFGGYGAIRVSEVKNGNTQVFDDNVTKWYDFGLTFGLGSEYNISSLDNKVYILFLYNLGLTNAVSGDLASFTTAEDLKVKNNTFEFVFGYKF